MALKFNPESVVRFPDVAETAGSDASITTPGGPVEQHLLPSHKQGSVTSKTEVDAASTASPSIPAGASDFDPDALDAALENVFDKDTFRLNLPCMSGGGAIDLWLATPTFLSSVRLEGGALMCSAIVDEISYQCPNMHPTLVEMMLLYMRCKRSTAMLLRKSNRCLESPTEQNFCHRTMEADATFIEQYIGIWARRYGSTLASIIRLRISLGPWILACIDEAKRCDLWNRRIVDVKNKRDDSSLSRDQRSRKRGIPSDFAVDAERSRQCRRIAS